MNPRHTSQAFADNDRGVAAVVGFVLVLAAGITYFSYTAQNEVPRIGAQNERAWDAEVGAALARLAQGAGERAGTDTSVSEVLPPAPEAPSQTVPFLSALRSVRASGSVAYETTCAGATLAHTTGTTTVTDLASGARGCLSFKGDTAYADSFSYRIENGGLLRAQGGRAAVLVGPPLDVSADHVALTLVELRGTSQSLGVDRASAPVSLTPRTGALDVGSAINADVVTWTFTTDYPEAWRDHYADRFSAAGVLALTSFTCADPSATGTARGPCEVTIALTQPTSLSISYGRYDVDLS